MPELPNEPPPNQPRYQPDLTGLTICAEVADRLGELIDDARADFLPRNFAERYLVDELAFSQWRRFRAGIMQKSVYEHEEVTFQPSAGTGPDGQPLEPHEDMFHMAMAHSPGRHAVVLAALGRLEARYHREFCVTLRLLIALRRGEAPPVPGGLAPVADISTKKGTHSCESCLNSSLSTQ